MKYKIIFILLFILSSCGSDKISTITKQRLPKGQYDLLLGATYNDINNKYKLIPYDSDYYDDTYTFHIINYNDTIEKVILDFDSKTNTLVAIVLGYHPNLKNEIIFKDIFEQSTIKYGKPKKRSDDYGPAYSWYDGNNIFEISIQFNIFEIYYRSANLKKNGRRAW